MSLNIIYWDVWPSLVFVYLFRTCSTGIVVHRCGCTHLLCDLHSICGRSASVARAIRKFAFDVVLGVEQALLKYRVAAHPLRRRRDILVVLHDDRGVGAMEMPAHAARSFGQWQNICLIECDAWMVARRVCHLTRPDGERRCEWM